jgi:S-adenosylmethionine:tRNA-ribosyltransferase-isomerase (queuine synthetase)
MAQNTADTTEATTPISNSTISAVARKHDVAEEKVSQLMDKIQSEIEQHGLVSDFDALHDVVGDKSNVRVYLTQHATEVDELASHAAGQAGINFPQYVSAEQIAREAFDRDAKERYWQLFGSEQGAVDATGAGDALVVKTDE